jgi:hypothetical protein
MNSHGPKTHGLIRLANSIPLGNPLLLALGLLYASREARELTPADILEGRQSSGARTPRLM